MHCSIRFPQQEPSALLGQETLCLETCSTSGYLRFFLNSSCVQQVKIGTLLSAATLKWNLEHLSAELHHALCDLGVLCCQHREESTSFICQGRLPIGSSNITFRNMKVCSPLLKTIKFYHSRVSAKTGV